MSRIPSILQSNSSDRARTTNRNETHNCWLLWAECVRVSVCVRCNGWMCWNVIGILFCCHSSHQTFWLDFHQYQQHTTIWRTTWHSVLSTCVRCIHVIRIHSPIRYRTFDTFEWKRSQTVIYQKICIALWIFASAKAHGLLTMCHDCFMFMRLGFFFLSLSLLLFSNHLICQTFTDLIQ